VQWTDGAMLLGAHGAFRRPAPVLGDRRLAARAGLALVSANVRYWATVAPHVRVQLQRWRQRANAIPDAELRRLALCKLEREASNAQAGAMLATFAPRAQRANVVEAIVALQVLFDLLDGLTERPSEDPIAEGERLFCFFTDALREPARVQGSGPLPQDGYLLELSSAARYALARLPAAAAVSPAAVASAERAAQAQIRMHAVPRLGIEQLRSWAHSEASGSGLPWRELIAGSASSVLVVHALSAAAADPSTTPAKAGRIAGAYLSIGVLLTLLDSITDRDEDAREGAAGYIGLYQDEERLCDALLQGADRAARRARELPHPERHLMILAAVVAYYTSTPAARGELSRPLVEPLHQSLRPLISPTLAAMTIWHSAARRSGRPKRSPGVQGGLS